MGVINWFPVHGVSMNSSNQLISGDHKGLASQLLEKYINPKTQLSGTVSVNEFCYFYINYTYTINDYFWFQLFFDLSDLKKA